MLTPLKARDLKVHAWSRPDLPYSIGTGPHLDLMNSLSTEDLTELLRKRGDLSELFNLSKGISNGIKV